jgi:uncharacterized BrkB/YihY/UPF0761 family membrane protein
VLQASLSRHFALPLLIVTVSIGSFFSKTYVQALVLNLAENSLPVPADVVIDMINEILTQRSALGIVSLITWHGRLAEC